MVEMLISESSERQANEGEIKICGEGVQQLSESASEPSSSQPESPGRQKLRSWLNKSLKVQMTDGRVLVGVFLCTDRDANVILGSCSEYLQPDDGSMEEPRVLGLVMVPGRHIVSIHLDELGPKAPQELPPATALSPDLEQQWEQGTPELSSQVV